MPLLKILLIALSVLMAAMVLVIAISRLHFNRVFKQKVEKLFASRSTAEGKVIIEEDISGLPDPVQRFLRYTGVIGRRRVACVRLKQVGAMRPKPGGRWFPLKAEEYYSVNPPGFVWKGDLAFAPFLSAAAQDMYLNGQGNMHVKLLSTFTMVDARGKEMDEASLMRYFNEMQWFPTSLLGSHVKWEAMDADSARATLTDRGLSVSAVFCFDNEGKITNFIAERARSTDGVQLVRTKWSTPISAYGTFSNGLRLPGKGEAVWHLDEGEYAYIRLEITDVEYDNPSLY